MNNIDISSSIHNPLVQETNKNVKNSSDPLNLQKNFLNLLMAQIKNQDPTDPIKNTELTSQLAQINTASGIAQLNNTVGHFSNQINQNKNIQASSLIGHHVMTANNEMIHTENSETQFGMEVLENTNAVKIQIRDNNNKVIYAKKIENLPVGVHLFLWDGKDLNNENVPTGKYNISLLPEKNDKNIPINILTEALVNSVITSSNSDPILNLDTLEVATLSNIRAILK